MTANIREEITVKGPFSNAEKLTTIHTVRALMPFAELLLCQYPPSSVVGVEKPLQPGDPV